MTDQRDCKHGRQLGKCDSCDLEEAERTIAHLRQHKNDYMEAAEQTKKALESELKKVKADRQSCWAEFKVLTRDCLRVEKERDAAMQQLLDTQHELALLHDHYKLYPGAWCCDAARWSNGWNHATNCKNWVLTL